MNVKSIFKVVLLFSVALFVLGGCTDSSTFKIKANPASVMKAADGSEFFLFSASDFRINEPRWYSYEHNGKIIRFFVVKDQNNIMKAAFDASNTCFRHKLGYTFENCCMVCFNCGTQAHLPILNTPTHIARINNNVGCNPFPLARTIEGGRVIIRKEDVIAGEIYF